MFLLNDRIARKPAATRYGSAIKNRGLKNKIKPRQVSVIGEKVYMFRGVKVNIKLNFEGG
jgi:hypothetical protein